MKFVKEFRDFAVKGNVFDMAVGIIIGAAFSRLAGAFVSDIMMPPLGLAAGNMDFSDQKITLRGGTAAVIDAGTGKVLTPGVPEVAISYGHFISVCIDFFLMALAVFILVKIVSQMKRKEAVAPAAPPSRQEQLLEEIRDLLVTKA